MGRKGATGVGGGILHQTETRFPSARVNRLKAHEALCQLSLFPRMHQSLLVLSFNKTTILQALKKHIHQRSEARDITKCNLMPQDLTSNVRHSLYNVLRSANFVDQGSHGTHDAIQQPEDESVRPVRTGVDNRDHV